MPATKSTKQVESKKATPVETPAPAQATPANKKGGAKKVEAVPAPVPAPQATSAPATKKGGAKKAVATPVEAVPTPVPVAQATPAPASKKGGAKKAVSTPVEAVPAEATPAPATKKGGAVKQATSVPKAKKAVAPKTKKAVAPKEDDEASVEEKQGVRSFKVQLPGSEDYTGRFTGLTPYQAANKALSKFFRENKESNGEITFSIRESTRGSKRNVYSYNGKREKLPAPVKYSIEGKDATTGKAVTREIVKEYKNRLTKIKKAVAKEATA
jgi:hypothetical protein